MNPAQDRRPHRRHHQKPSERPAELIQISEETARFGLLRLIATQLSAAGFTHVSHRSVVEDLEGLVSGLLDGIVQLAYELAQLSNRSRPNVRDMLAACADQGIELHHLNEILSIEQPAPSQEVKFEIPRARSEKPSDPTLDFLPSDPESEDAQDGNGADIVMASSHPKRRRPNSERIGGLPHLPSLPAKHTWIHTASMPSSATVIPPEHLTRQQTTTTQPMTNLLTTEFLKADEQDPNTPSCLGFLNRRIRDTRLVERSLTNLVQPNSILSSSGSPPKLPPPVLQLPPSSPLRSPPKLALSEADIPIINFEHDWYPDQHSPLTDRQS
ncbi:hypothetical protein PtA15_8A402 [Puccinia triticina]|uniref:Bromodomain associated domain-containing protein n=1 Tax=Puccinia triticina TaxID=208348 RepID=A0ABY7CRD8_9BASI|nr:uncharacterized protein PtA15_8A402 [Puccinia triticina]WAQ87498.1 hypothetical protein PtA15_8A402 [Puccinia triticina]WAR57356.1 hypothetical protein PtB15_8B403 [Puccinia triticina]